MDKTDARNLYLDLMKRCLTNWVYGAEEVRECRGRNVKGLLARLAAARGLRLVEKRPMNPERRREGSDHPPTAHTMIGMRRLDALQNCVEEVLAHGVPGDLVETGVWRGGSVIFMRAVLKAWGVTDRVVWVADSFRGLPPPDPTSYPADAGDRHFTRRELAISAADVRRNFAAYGLLDEQVRFLEGWFKDTLPAAPFERLAVMRLDGDLYESTMDALTHLYPKLSPGGFAIVDDYGLLPPCRQAVDDYRRAHGIAEPVVPIDRTGVFWRRGE